MTTLGITYTQSKYTSSHTGLFSDVNTEVSAFHPQTGVLSVDPATVILAVKIYCCASACTCAETLVWTTYSAQPEAVHGMRVWISWVKKQNKDEHNQVVIVQ